MTNLSLSNDQSKYDQLELISRQFVNRLRNGEAVEINEYAMAHPEIAEDIREFLEAVVIAEQLNKRTKLDSQGEESPELPKKLGPFILQREIGRGGMGIVYEATQAPFSQTFAIKVLKPRLISSRTLESRFEREAQAASRLHHPNIVPAKHYGTEAGQNFLVMPMIDGVSLDRLIRNDESVDPKIKRLFEEICSDWSRIAELGARVNSALSHAHSNGMIHRDIKPANLILDSDGNIWVTDFGLAKLYDDESDLSRTGELIGTPRYMAPEQLLGEADARSDIYGVGLTLYEIITRDCPWNRRTNACNPATDQTKYQLLKKPTLLLDIADIRTVKPSVPQSLADVIMKACAHHPENRYQSAREFEMDLNEICYRGQTDRRYSSRSLATASQYQARNVAVLLGVICCIAISGWITLWAIYPNQKSGRIQNEMGVARSIPNCVVFKEPDTGLMNVTAAICARTDDAEQWGEGHMYLDSNDLELTWDDCEQIVGLRFQGVQIAPGTKVHSAKLCFCANRGDFVPTALKIHGIGEANTQTFTLLNYDLSNRPRTNAFVPWEPEAWVSGEEYDSADCRDVVQEIIDHPQWKSGNAMGFVIEGTGIRKAVSYDRGVNCPVKLIIKYRPEN